MKHELPPQKGWPHGVHLPGNSGESATPTMEKLAVQGSHSVEQKEASSFDCRGREQELSSNHHPDCPAFQFRRVLGHQITVITGASGLQPPVELVNGSIPLLRFV